MSITKPPCDEAVIENTSGIKPCISKSEPWILAATILGSSMAFIDGTVVNVALPILQKDLHASVADVQWIVESYALFLSALILVGGSLGDRLGRRRIFAIGIALFTLASLCCGLASNVTLLIIARAVQGIGGALLVPGSLAIIGASFSPEKRGRAIGTWSGFTSITAAIGPVLGGWLVQYANWRWVFFINVPFAIVVLTLLFWHVPESRDEEADHRLDWWGAGLVTAGLGTLVYGLIEAGQVGFGDPMVVSFLILGILLLIAFVIVETRVHAPMLPLSLFRSRNFSGANALTLLLYAAAGGALFFFPFNLVQVQHYSPTAAGAAMLPFILIMFLLSRWSGGLVNRFGSRLPLIIGPVIAAVGYVLYAIPGIGTGESSYWFTYFPAVIVLGLGMAITAAPLTTTVMGSVATHQAGVASGVNNAVARTAGLLAIAILGIVMATTFNSNLDQSLAAVHATPALQQVIDAQRTKLVAIEIPPDVSIDVATSLRQGINESFIAGFRVVMLTAAGLALASALMAALLIEGKASGSIKSPTQEEKTSSEVGLGD
ncbi:MAG TPA: MFS transporter [Ktedonosporobacter sp.]|nr:MFS transporter [Ktedonosporobacter sp.]